MILEVKAPQFTTTFRCSCGKWQMLGPVAIDYARGTWKLHSGGHLNSPEHVFVIPQCYEESGGCWE